MNTVGLHFPFFFFTLLTKASRVSSPYYMNSHWTKTANMSEQGCQPYQLTQSIWYHFWSHISSFSLPFFFLLLSISPPHFYWKLWQLSQYTIISPPVPPPCTWRQVSQWKRSSPRAPHLCHVSCVRVFVYVCGVTTIELTEWGESPFLYV
jgi:hypothetical protein